MKQNYDVVDIKQDGKVVGLLAVGRFKHNGKPYRLRRKSPHAMDRAKAWEFARVEYDKLWNEAKDEANGVVVKKVGPLLKEYEATYLAAITVNGQTPATVSSKKSHLNAWLVPCLGKYRLSDITTPRVEKELKAKLVGNGPSHINNVLNTLSALLHYAVKTKEIDAMPCEIDLVKQPKPKLWFFEQDELDDLLKAAGDGHLVMLLLGSDAGLRAGEIAALEWPDIDYATNRIHVQRAVWRNHVGLPRHGKTRQVRMTKRLAAALKAHRHLRGPRVLYQADGSPLTRKVLSGWLKDCERAAGLDPKGRLHILRHTFCSHLAMRGVPVHVIRDLAGHHSITVTQRYMWLAKGSEAEAIASLETVRALRETGSNRAEPIAAAANS